MSSGALKAIPYYPPLENLLTSYHPSPVTRLSKLIVKVVKEFAPITKTIPK